MFQSARLKLTAWYLLIIMLISVLFSVAIYNFLTHEFERIERTQRFRIEQEELFGSQFLPGYTVSPFDPQVYEEARTRVLYVLILVNAGILITSGAAGYFLAGRTLQPIKNMIDDQNRFITDASHELRTPITSLKSEIEVYMRGKQHSVKEADSLLASNLEEVNNLQVLSDNLMQLAHYPKPNGAVAFADVSLTEILQASEKKLFTAAKQKSITIEIKIHEYRISGDKETLIQFFSIFLDNAIKYSPSKSKITISSETTDHSVLIHITDQGIGIEKKDIPHIFDRFYRADSSRTKQTVSGYGLGLSIAKKIIETHQGSVEVKSEVGKGTTFTVHLPYEKKI